MSILAHENTAKPAQNGGVLSRMFNALTPKFLKDYINEIKQELKAIDREREWHRQEMIKDAVEDIIKNSTPENYDRDIQKILDLNKANKESNFFDCGNITFNDLKNHLESLTDNQKEALKRPSPTGETATFEA